MTDEIDRHPNRDLVAVALLVVVITAVFADVLFFGVSLAGGDLPQYHFGIEKVVRDLVTGGHFPLWNRLIEAGQPIAANPAYEVYYPLQWLIFLPSVVFGFKLHVVVHFYIAALGMYALCRALRFSSLASLIGALAFALGGPLMSVNGYLPFLFSMAWLPWVLFFAWRYHLRGKRADLALASLAFAMQLLVGEPVVIIQTAALVGLGAIALRRIRPAIAIVIAGAALAAVQLVPAVDHARDSVRAIPLDYPAVSAWSTAVARPLELLVPSVSIAPRRFVGVRRPFITSIYLGFPLAIFAIAGFVRRIRGSGWAAAVLAVSYLLAIGDHTPLLRILYDAHVLSSIRYPEKFLFSGMFAVSLVGVAAFQKFLDGDSKVGRVAMIAAFAVAGAALVCAVASSEPFVRWTWNLPRGAGVAALVPMDRRDWIAAAVRGAIVAALALFALRGRSSAALWAAFAVADLVAAGSGLLLRVDDRFYSEPPPLLAQLPPPGDRIFHQVAFERALGMRPMRGSSYETRWLIRNEMVPYIPAAWGRATVLSYDYDETTLLPSRRIRAAGDIARHRGDPSWPRAFMALSNAPFRIVPNDPVAAVANAGGDFEKLTPVTVVREPIDAPRYSFATRLVPCRDIFDCTSVLSRAGGERIALLPPSFHGAALAGGEVVRVVEQPSSADLDVVSHGDGFLNISVTFHKYWHATIDGRPARLIPANLAYQGLYVPAGPHRVHLEYRNPMIGFGAVMSGIALLVVAAFGFFPRPSSRIGESFRA